jgi:hypothetical protein
MMSQSVFLTIISVEDKNCGENKLLISCSVPFLIRESCRYETVWRNAAAAQRRDRNAAQAQAHAPFFL